ncbi:MAG: glycosyltransferase family 39 protein [Undibacterium sp.]|nr:glycosyltransferase family 39 protein [Opitutaceae bacterium]
MAPTYPIGLPLALAALAAVTSWQLAPPLVMLASALAAVALMLPLGRAAGPPRGWSIFGALLFAASPLTTFMSVQLMSDIPATAVATAAVLCAWHSRTRRSWALVAGVAFAISVLIRPSNLLLLAPVAICLGTDSRRWLLFGAGGLPGAVVQLAYSARAYGNPLASGYGGEINTKFTLGIIPPTLVHYAQWLPVLLTPVVFFALVLPWWGRRQRFTWVLTTWIVVIFGFYVSYFHTHETWWYLRFLLPAFPPFIAGGLWTLHQLWIRHGAPRLTRPLVTRRLALAAGVVALTHGALWHYHLNAASIGYGESIYPDTLAWARTHLPGDAIILTHQTSGALQYYTDYTLIRWDSLNAERFARVTAAAINAHRPIFAILFPHEIKPVRETHAVGQWTQFAAVRHMTIWQWSPARP